MSGNANDRRKAKRLFRRIFGVDLPSAQRSPLEDRSYKAPIPLPLLKIITFMSLLLSGGGFVLGIYFWWATGFMYIVFFLSALDVLLEPGLNDRRLMKAVGLMTIGGLAFLFTIGIVLRPAPLLIRVRGYMGNYTSNTTVAGIQWKPEYTEVRAVLNNATDNDYSKVDVVLSPNPHTYLIAAFGQPSNMPGVTIMNTEIGQDSIHLAGKDKFGKPIELTGDNPDVSLFTGTIRVLCDRLPKHTVIEIVMAVVNLNITESGDEVSVHGQLLAPKDIPPLMYVSCTYESVAGHPQECREHVFPIRRE